MTKVTTIYTAEGSPAGAGIDRSRRKWRAARRRFPRRRGDRPLMALTLTVAQLVPPQARG